MARTFQMLTAPVALKAGQILRITTSTGDYGVYRVNTAATVYGFTSLAASGILQFIPAESQTPHDPLLGGGAIATVENDTTATLSGKFMWFVDFTTGKLNEIVAKVNSLTGRVSAVETLAASKAAIDDTALTSTATTLSASKIGVLNAGVLADANAFASNAANEAKNAAVAQLSGVDSTQLEALNALQAAFAANETADSALGTQLLNKVDFSLVQKLTDAQAAQARSNIKFDAAVASAINTAMGDIVGDVSAFNPTAILANATALI